MKKSNLKLKRILSTSLAFLIAAGTFAGVKLPQASAAAENAGAENNSAYYDFQEDKGYLDIGVSYNQGDTTVKIAEDGENRYLEVNAPKGDKMMINFPFVLENDSLYLVRYKIKDSDKVTNLQASSGIYIGAATGKQPDEDGKTAQIKIGDFLSEKLYQFENIRSNTWLEKATVISTGERVTDELKYLSFVLQAADVYKTVCLDDVSIEKISADSAYYSFENSKEYLDLGAKWNQNDATVEIAEETGNKYLRAYVPYGDKIMINFPFLLENNTTYSLTYRIKDENSTTVLSGNSGICAGQSTGKGNSNPLATMGDKQSAIIYKFESGINSTEWKEYNTVFTTGESVVTDTQKYLSIALRVNNTGSVYKYVDIDDISISKISYGDVSVDYENGTRTPVTSGSHLSVVNCPTDDNADNHALKLDLTGSYYTPNDIFVLPAKLKAGNKYVLSFDYMTDIDNDNGVESLSGVSVIGASADGSTIENADRYSYLLTDDSFDMDYKWNQRIYKNDGWKNRKITFTAKDSDDGKYLAIRVVNNDAAKNSGIYFDNFALYTPITLTFDYKLDGKTETVTSSSGKSVTAPVAARMGYDFLGWYDDNGFVANGGDVITCPSSNVTYTAKWSDKLTKYSTGFENAEEKLLYTTNTPEVAADPDDEGNKVLQLSNNGGNKYNITLPVELEAGKTYTVKFRIKAKPVKGGNNVQLTKTNEIGEGANKEYNYTNGSYISYAEMNGNYIAPLAYIMSDVFDINNNKVIDQKTDIWGQTKAYTYWTERTYEFTATEKMTGKFAALQIKFYFDDTKYAGEMIYLDDVSIRENPVATFISSNEATAETISTEPGKTIKPTIPTKTGYSFTGWYTPDGTYAGFDALLMPETDTTYVAGWKYIAAVGNVDCSEDGAINSLDIAELKKMLLGISETNAAVADCNGDGNVDILDLVRLKKYVANPSGTVLGKTVGEISGYTLAFEDEFDGKTLSPIWETRSAQSSISDIYYSNDKEHIFLENGTVVLRSTKKDGKYYLTSGIRTDNTLNFKHGYAEIRAKMPYYGQREWPAFWMLSSCAKLAKQAGDSGTWDIEIDAFESISKSDSFIAQLHKYNTEDGTSVKNLISSNVNTAKVTDTDAFHTYGVQWTDSELKFYLDGACFCTYTFDAENKEIFNRYVNVIINTSFLSDSYIAANNSDESYKALTEIFDTKGYFDMVIDYVRIYQKPGEGGMVKKAENKYIALTFDDAPTVQKSFSEYVDLFKQYDGKATFFVVGKAFEGKDQAALADSIKYAVDNGFEFGNHSYSHEKFYDNETDTQLKNEAEIKEEIESTDAVMKNISGYDMNLVRLPQLAYNNAILSQLKGMGKPSISDAYDSKDWKTELTAETIIENFKNNPPAAGDIVLCHMGNKSYAVMQEVLQYLYDDGYRFVTVSELFGINGVEMPLGKMITSVK